MRHRWGGTWHGNPDDEPRRARDGGGGLLFVALGLGGAAALAWWFWPRPAGAAPAALAPGAPTVVYGGGVAPTAFAPSAPTAPLIPTGATVQPALPTPTAPVAPPAATPLPAPVPVPVAAPTPAPVPAPAPAPLPTISPLSVQKLFQLLEPPPPPPLPPPTYTVTETGVYVAAPIAPAAPTGPATALIGSAVDGIVIEQSLRADAKAGFDYWWRTPEGGMLRQLTSSERLQFNRNMGLGPSEATWGVGGMPEL